MDSPWLMVSVAHRLDWPRRPMFQAVLELTLGKAWTLKNLVMNVAYRNQGLDREGKIHIYTPATTYLRVRMLGYVLCSPPCHWTHGPGTWFPAIQNFLHAEGEQHPGLIPGHRCGQFGWPSIYSLQN